MSNVKTLYHGRVLIPTTGKSSYFITVGKGPYKMYKFIYGVESTDRPYVQYIKKISIPHLPDIDDNITINNIEYCYLTGDAAIYKLADGSLVWEY